VKRPVGHQNLNLAELKEKAKSGSVVSQGLLGHNYLWGNGVTPDYDEAIKWLSLAAEKGVAQSLFNLGYMYEQGLGVSKNLNTAIEYFKKAAKRKCVDAFLSLGTIYAEGDKADKQASEKWFNDALGLGDGNSSRIAYKFFKGYGLPKNLKYAFLWYNISHKRTQEMIDNIRSTMDDAELKDAEVLLKSIE